MLPCIQPFLVSTLEVAYLFGGGVALLACFKASRNSRHPPVPAGNVTPKFGCQARESVMLSRLERIDLRNSLITGNSEVGPDK